MGESGREGVHHSIYIPICQHKRSVLPGLLQGVIPIHVGVVWSRRQDGEFLVHVAAQEREERDDGEDDVGDEGGDDFCEGLRDAVIKILINGCMTCMYMASTHI